MSKNDIFWTDMQQAQERLLHSVVMYDGSPVYVHSLINGAEFPDGDHRALLVSCDTKREESRKKLNSPKFNRFRTLPTMGWLNVDSVASGRISGAVYMSRRAITTQRHGLNNNNVLVQYFRDTDKNGNTYLQGTGDYGFLYFIYDSGFVNMQKGVYPSLEATLNNIVQGTAIAISPKFCVQRDGRGIRWLYRNNEIVGLFTGVDTLNLLTKFAFLREEIMDDPVFTINTIREF